MTDLFMLAKSDCCTSDCHNGQIWNPGVGPVPRPLCRPNTDKSGGAR